MAGTENPGIPQSRVAGSDCTNKRFGLEVAGGAIDRAGDGEAAHGVVAMISTGSTGTVIPAGDECPFVSGGGKVVLVESGAAVADAVEVMSDSVGRGVTAAGAGKFKLGKVVNGSSASAAGQDLSVMLYAVPQIVI